MGDPDLTRIAVSAYPANWRALIAAIDPQKRRDYEVDAAVVAIEDALGADSTPGTLA